MANIKSSKKRSIQSIKNKKNNFSKKSKIKTLIKKVNTAIHSKKKKNAEKIFKETQKIIDRYSNKGLIHKNKAARHKSILIKKIKLM